MAKPPPLVYLPSAFPYRCYAFPADSHCARGNRIGHWSDCMPDKHTLRCPHMGAFHPLAMRFHHFHLDIFHLIKADIRESIDSMLLTH